MATARSPAASSAFSDPDTTTDGGDHVTKAKPKITLSFSCGGWFQMYHHGVAQAIKDARILDNFDVRLCGVSAGSLAVTALAGDCDFYEMRHYALECGDDCRKSLFNVFKMKTYLLDSIRRFGEGPMRPENIDSVMKRLKKYKLEVYTTSLPRMRSMVLKDFKNLDDVAEALCASCCMTPFVGFPFRLNRGQGPWVIDGGLSSFQPRKHDNAKRKKKQQSAAKSSLTDSPTTPEETSAWDPEPHQHNHHLRDADPEDDYRTICIAPFYFTDADIKPSVVLPVWWSLRPPVRPVHATIFDHGYNDAMKYFMRHGMTPRDWTDEEAELLMKPIPEARPLTLVDRVVNLGKSTMYLFVARPMAAIFIYLELWMLLALALFAAVVRREGAAWSDVYEHVRAIVSPTLFAKLWLLASIPVNEIALDKRSSVYRFFAPFVFVGKKRTHKSHHHHHRHHRHE